MYPFILFEYVNSFVVDLYCPMLILCLVGYETDYRMKQVINGHERCF